jgi:hypothetical protein
VVVDLLGQPRFAASRLGGARAVLQDAAAAREELLLPVADRGL